MKWTDEQQRAINARGGNLLLAAAAGSGKTAVLVERVLSLIDEGADLERMLVVTFTRAAAADMRQKLLEKLTDSALDNVRFRRQTEKIERASISTIHSFCTELLRTHFQAASVDPGFRIVQGAERDQLMAASLNDTLEKAYERPDDDLNALSYGRPPAVISELITELHTFLMARPNPEGWVAEALQKNQQGDPAWAELLASEARNDLRSMVAELSALQKSCALPGGAIEYQDTLASDIRQLTELLELDYEALQAQLNNLKMSRIPQVKEKTPAHQAVHERRTAVLDERKKLAENLPPLKDSYQDAVQNTPALRALCKLALELESNYRQRKEERSALDFNDLEHRALLALSDPAVRQSVQQKYDYVFVDEYQDTSDVQEEILQKASRGDNLFMVGDVKQSIYRFRQAEPRLFMDKYDAYGAQGEGNSSPGQLLLLSRNFRSRASVLNFTNRVFARSMHRSFSEIEYDENAHLVPGANYPNDHPPVELQLITAQEDPGETQPQDEVAQAIEDMNAAEKEALLAARRIQGLLGTPFYDLKLGGERATEPRDICVLSRVTSNIAHTVVRTLLDQGIPAYADAQSGYFDVLEVRTVLSLLELIDNGRRDLALLSVLRSPIGGFSTNDLAQIRAYFKATSFAEAVRRYATEMEDKLSQNLTTFLDQIEHFRLLVGALPLGQFIDSLLIQTGYLDYVGALPGGEQRQANLSLLSSRAQSVDDSQSGGLSGFVQYIRKLHSTGDDTSPAHTLSEGDNVVRVMSVHKSKGLQFPVVIALQMGRQVRSRGGKSGLLAHRDLGLALMLNDEALGSRREPISRKAIAVQKRKEDMAEELRILYVLMTRAMNRLILVGSVKNREAECQRYAAIYPLPEQFKSYLDVLAPVAMRTPGGQPLWPEGQSIPIEENASPVEVHWVSPADLLLPAARQIDSARSIQNMMDQWLAGPLCDDFSQNPMARRIFWRYPYADAVLAPLKLTASGLNREIEGPLRVPELMERPSFLEEESMTGAEQGSAVHAAMQALNLNMLKGLHDQQLHQEIANQLEEMLQNGLLTPPMHQAVSPSILAAFFESNLGKRLLRAQVLHREWAFNLRMSAAEALGEEFQQSAGNAADQRLLVQGVVDCCFLEDGAWILLDYKTDRSRDIDSIVVRYRSQLNLYARALSEITACPVAQKVLCLLRLGKQILL